MVLLAADEEQSDSPSFYSIMLYFDLVLLTWPVSSACCGGQLVLQFR